MTLDKHWKRYVEMLPKPNQLAKVYGASELEFLIRDLEMFVQGRIGNFGSATIFVWE